MERNQAAIRRAGLVLTCLCCLAALVVAADYVAYQRFIARLRALRPRRAQLFDERLLAKTASAPALWNSVGSFDVRDEQASRYYHFPLRKPPGAIRIGAFGDSFTYGYEAGKGQDFPSQLARMFRDAGARNVEVMNFGNNWHGFHQTYRVWEELGRRYDLDFVLLGPETFYPERDETFAHGLPGSPYYIHGRYVLGDRGELEFIDAKGGADLDARFAEYFRFFPHWDYLRHDVNAPAFLSCLLPAGRVLSNPFYYFRGAAAEETRRVWTLLLGRMAAAGPQIILLHTDADTAALGGNAGPILSESVPALDRFPYFRNLHEGAIGYEEFARLYFSALTVQPELRHFELEIRDARTERVETIRAPLSAYKRAVIRIGGATAGELAFLGSIDDDEMDNHPVDPSREGFQALFALGSEGQSALDAWWVGLDFPLAPGDPVALAFDSSEGRKTFPLGRVSFLSPGVALGSLALNGLQRDYLGRTLQRVSREAAGLPAGTESLRDGRLMVAGRPVLRAALEGGNVAFSPLAPLLKFRPDKDMRIDLAKLPAATAVELALSGDAARASFRIGTANCVEARQSYDRTRMRRRIEIRRELRRAVLRSGP